MFQSILNKLYYKCHLNLILVIKSNLLMWDSIGQNTEDSPMEISDLFQFYLRGECKKTVFLGIFPKIRGGVTPIPKTFVKLPSHFWRAKFILFYSPILKSKCQNSDKILTFLFVNTKNDPYGLKCKINP